jgi:transketolase
MLLYSVLYLLGYQGATIEEIKRFRQLGSHAEGHPERGHMAGIETTTGPLGQGLGNSVGMAIAERMLAAQFGSDIVNHRTYVLASDGDLMEGISHEAISIAGHLRLNKLTVLYDDNGISIDGPLSLSETGDALERFRAAGWNAVRVNGQDPEAVAAALEAAQTSDRPSLIACKTTIGYGAPHKAGTAAAHGSPLGAEEIAAARKQLGWDYPPFVIPDDVRAAWHEAAGRSAPAHAAWQKRLEALDPAKRAEFERRMAGTLPAALGETFTALKEKLVAAPAEMATRKASEISIEAVVPVLPELITGSADLTPSNNTKVKGLVDINPDDFSGRYIHWGIREHGMASAMNGIALHGGFIPAGGTFLVFSDYCRPSIRLSALMGLRVIYIMTHDSIGVGEDGPTHQPVEHLAALRAIPGLLVFRPADVVETAECWQLALEAHRPSLLALSRQNVPQLRLKDSAENLCSRGAYEIAPSVREAQVSLFGTGTELSLAVEAKQKLEAAGIPTRVVSVPCMPLFLEQPADYRRAIIGNAPVKVAVEAAVRQSWDAIVGPEGGFVGMHGFGLSGPAKDVYRHFGITADSVVEAARSLLP